MYAGGWRFVLYASEMLEGMRRVLLRMLEAVEGELCLLEVPEVQEVMRCATLYTGGCGGFEFCWRSWRCRR